MIPVILRRSAIAVPLKSNQPRIRFQIMYAIQNNFLWHSYRKLRLHKKNATNGLIVLYEYTNIKHKVLQSFYFYDAIKRNTLIQYTYFKWNFH